MAENAPQLPPASIPVVDSDGRCNAAWYRYFQEDQRQALVRDDTALQTAQEAATVGGVVLNPAETPDGLYGHQAAVATVRIEGGQITAVAQEYISYPDSPFTIQTGWPASVAPTMSAGYVQAEAQGLADQLADLINALRSGGALDD